MAASYHSDVAGSKKLAKYAVKHVYQFTSSRKKYEATAYQKFLLQTRERLAMRFRMDCLAFDPAHPIHPNNYPYFVGVFNTVAALGSLAQATHFAVVYVIGAAVGSWFLSLLPNVPLIGYLSHILPIRAGLYRTRRNTYCNRVSYLRFDAREIRFQGSRLFIKRTA